MVAPTVAKPEVPGVVGIVTGVLLVQSLKLTLYSNVCATSLVESARRVKLNTKSELEVLSVGSIVWLETEGFPFNTNSIRLLKASFSGSALGSLSAANVIDGKVAIQVS